jgi:hypothetical protein
MRWTFDDFSDAAVRKALIDAMRADGGTTFRSVLQSCLKEGDRISLDPGPMESQRAGVRLWLPSFLLGLFKRLKNGLKLGCKKCPTLSGVGKALF